MKATTHPWWRRSSIALAISAAALAGYAGTALHAAPDTNDAAAKLEARANPSTSSLVRPGAIPASFADLAAAVRPAVVFIQTEGMQKTSVPHGQWQRIPGLPGFPFSGPDGHQQRVRGVGSGFIVDSDGLIVTNNHVIKGAGAIKVTLDDGTVHKATLVGTDPKTDLATLRIDVKRPLPTVRFGNSDQTRVGDWVVAVGNPFGLGGSVSAGIVSARGRDIQSGPYDDYLQFDAPINRGNSGGPLFNVRGEVIGVNTAIFSPSGGNVGIGFAVPASTAQPVVAALLADGHVDRGWAGVRIQALSPELAESVELDEPRGALVLDVEPNSPAERAGIKRRDVILSVAGDAVKDVRAAVRAIGGQPAGTEVVVEVWRDGKALKRSMTLAALPGQVADGDASGPTSPAVPEGKRLGVSLSELNNEARRRMGIDKDTEGAVIVSVEPDSAAAKSRLRAGDVIVMVDDHDVRGPQDVARQIAVAAKHDRPVMLLIERAGGQRFIAVKLS